MINSKRELKEWLYEEKKRYIKNGQLYTFLRFAGFEEASIWHFQKRLRKTEYYKNCGLKIRYICSKIILNKLQNKTGLHIATNVFDKGLHIMHLGYVLTNGNARVGQNCILHVGTALVADGRNDSVPILGNDVVICVGAILIGNISIADKTVVAAGAIVTTSFDKCDITIGGVPAKIICDIGRTNWHNKTMSH